MAKDTSDRIRPKITKVSSLSRSRTALVELPIPPRRPPRALASKAPYLILRSRRRRPLDRTPLYWSLSLLGGGFSSFFLAIVITLSIVANYAYSYYLTQVNALHKIQLASGFETSRVYDRNGRLLYEFNSFGRRDQVKLDQVSPVMIQATIDIEDKNFWTNNGIDYLRTMKAAYDDIRCHCVVSGASTITQQLIKDTLLSSEVNTPTKSSFNDTIARRKIPEAILSYGLTQQYSKQQILQLYLNTIYYGNLAYGVKAATNEYFGGETDPAKRVDVSHLDLAHASMLAGLPQSPSVYNPLQHPQAAFIRQKDVLEAMVNRGDITPEEATHAIAISHKHDFFKPPHPVILAPHFVYYVQNELEQMFENGTLVINGGGLRIETTIDMDIQDEVQRIVQRHVQEISNHHVNNGSAVVVNPHNGEILAMVGSANYNDPAINGQFNAAVDGLLQPGSAFKPFAYATAFAKGWSPGTVVLDAPTTFPGYRTTYKPVNYDGMFHGAVTLRTALANSFNIPAIKVLQYAGIEDTLRLAKAMGVKSLKDQSAYGLSLVLGGAQVSVLDMTSAYGVFANGGARVSPTAIRRITTSTGKVIVDYEAHPRHITPIISPQLAYLVTDILKDNAARAPEFGLYSPLRLEYDRPAAAKTGTTDDFRDNWTIGYTPDFTVGTWVGNSDGSPMENIIGIDGAGPIWHDTMELLEGQHPFKYFQVPDGLERITMTSTGRLSSRYGGVTDWVIANAAPKEYDNGSFSLPYEIVTPTPYVRPRVIPRVPSNPGSVNQPGKPIKNPSPGTGILPQPGNGAANPPISAPLPVLPPRSAPPNPSPKH